MATATRRTEGDVFIGFCHLFRTFYGSTKVQIECQPPRVQLLFDYLPPEGGLRPKDVIQKVENTIRKINTKMDNWDESHQTCKYQGQ